MAAEQPVAPPDLYTPSPYTLKPHPCQGQNRKIVLFDTFLKGSGKRKKCQKVSDRQKCLYSWRVRG